MSRFSFSKSKHYRRVRFKTSAGVWVFLTIWRDVFGTIHTVKNVCVQVGVLTWGERKFQAVRHEVLA